MDDKSANECLPDISGCMPTSNSMSGIPVDPDGNPRESGEESPTPDIETHRAVALNDLSASSETIQTIAFQIGQCSGLLAMTMEVTT